MSKIAQRLDKVLLRVDKRSYYDTQGLSELLSEVGIDIKKRSLENMRSQGRGIKSTKIFGRVVYSIDDIKAYLLSIGDGCQCIGKIEK